MTYIQCKSVITRVYNRTTTVIIVNTCYYHICVWQQKYHLKNQRGYLYEYLIVSNKIKLDSGISHLESCTQYQTSDTHTSSHHTRWWWPSHSWWAHWTCTTHWHTWWHTYHTNNILVSIHIQYISSCSLKLLIWWRVSSCISCHSLQTSFNTISRTISLRKMLC